MLPTSFAIDLFVCLFFFAQDDAGLKGSFDQLGNLFLGGILGAVGLALIVVFIRLKMQGRRDATRSYMSIKPSEHDGQE